MTHRIINTIFSLNKPGILTRSPDEETLLFSPEANSEKIKKVKKIIFALD